MSSEPPVWTQGVQSHMSPQDSALKLFVLQGTENLGLGIAKCLGVAPSVHEEREFPDGEHKARPLDNVCGAEVYVVHSLHGGPVQSANDKLCRLLFFIGALKDAGAAHVTAVTPYLCYARKDRRTKPNDPVTTRYIARMFESVGVNCIVTLEVHNEAAFENAFNCRTVALSAAPLFLDKAVEIGGDAVCVVSPDTGGAKRADIFRLALESRLQRPVGSAFAEKHRSGGIVSGELFVGDVAGATALIVDDLIGTGYTMVRTARAARAAGAKSIVLLAAHGLFMPGAEEALGDRVIDRVITSDTVPSFRVSQPSLRNKHECLSAAPLFAEAIRRLHLHLPLADMLVF